MSRQSHRQRIREDLRARILSGAVQPGDRLVDHALAAEMGVSRMPVREALMQLVSEGYLASTSRGFALPDLAPARIAEVFTLRRLLEPHAAALAAQSLPPETIAALSATLPALQTPEVAAFHRASESFRSLWIGALPDRTLSETIQRYSAQIQTVRRATLGAPAARQTVARAHAALTEAFRNRDGLGAADLTLRFIHQAEEAWTAQGTSA